MSRTNKKLFVSSLPQKITKLLVIEYFNQFGDIRGASSIFRIGNKKTRCIVIDCADEETKKTILSQTHQIAGRYIDCKDYLRGSKLKNHINKIQKNNVYLPFVDQLTTKEDIEAKLSIFGSIERIKIGFSVKENNHYSVVTFKAQNSATAALKEAYFMLNDQKLLIQKYCEGKKTHTKSRNSNPSALNLCNNKKSSFKQHRGFESQHMATNPSPTLNSCRRGPKGVYNKRTLKVPSQNSMDEQQLHFKHTSQAETISEVLEVSKRCIEFNHSPYNLNFRKSVRGRPSLVVRPGPSDYRLRNYYC